MQSALRCSTRGSFQHQNHDFATGTVYDAVDAKILTRNASPLPPRRTVQVVCMFDGLRVLFHTASRGEKAGLVSCHAR
jgi:hypothetical protein